MKTVLIQPTIAFANGKQFTATQFRVESIHDDLFSNVLFRYTLYGANGEYAGESTYELSGVDAYSTWDMSPEGAFEIVAAGIGLEIIPQDNKTLFLDVA